MKTHRFPSLLALASVAAVAAVPAVMWADDAKDKSAAKAGADEEEGFVSLFDGKSLDGWKANENVDTFKVEDGHIVVKGDRSHLFYVGDVENHDFKSFHFKAEVMTKPKANSGIYFHTEWQDDGWPAKGYEAQVNQTHGDAKKTGGLYGIKDVMDKSPTEDDKWHLYEIIVKGKHITIKIDGETTTDWTEPEGWKPPEQFPGRSLSSGTFALQGHDPESEIHYRNIRVKALED